MSFIVALIIIAACALLNRLRGDESWKPSWLPGRALFYVAPVVAAVACAIQPWPVALAIGAGYAFWAVWSWGHVLATVGHMRPARDPSWLESALLMLPGAILPVFVRMLFVLPGVLGVAALSGEPAYWIAAPAFAAAATAAYLLLFRPLGRLDWLRAEVVVGALWGVLIIGA